MIRKQSDGQYILYSKDGSRKLSKPGTLEEAKERERQVQYFKQAEKSIHDDLSIAVTRIMSLPTCVREDFLKSFEGKEFLKSVKEANLNKILD